MRVLTSRAATIAAQEGYGALRSTHRVNRGHDRHVTVGVVVLPVAAAVFLVMAWQVAPWSGGSVAGMLPSGITGLVLLALTVPAAIAMARRRGARVHVFEHGAIAERPGGDLYAWKHTRATVRYVRWQEPWEGERRDRPQLWVRFHKDGEMICFDGLDAGDRAGLPALARAFGIDEHPEQVDSRHSTKAPTPF